MSARVRLAGGPNGSASWAYLTGDGSLVFECYDHGEEANARFGNDVAFLARVGRETVGEVRRRLTGDADASDVVLLEACAARFASYFRARAWLEAEGMPFRAEFDPHA